MPRYEIFKSNRRTGDKKMVEQDVIAPNKNAALKKIGARKGKYLVIPRSVKTKYMTFYEPSKKKK